MEVIVFDWGDTLMRVFPQLSGPMVDWPEVQVISGVKEALEVLSSDYQLFVATGAKESNADQVKCALARVGLDGFFHGIFTHFEVGLQKSAEGFFRKIDQMINHPSPLIFVGDDYEVDINHTVRCGWRSVWFNPLGSPCVGLMPLHSIEIQSMRELPPLLKERALPDVNLAISWMIDQGANTNLLLHSLAVASVSYYLSLLLKNSGVSTNPILSHRGGLLHDIAKLTRRDPNELEIDHAEMGSRILIEKEQPELADITRSHLISSLFDEERKPATWEQKIVHYADKIVEGSNVVMLEERIQAICKRYPHHAERILGSVSGVKQLQSEICDVLGMSADLLKNKISQALLGMQ